jgi:hypothetical protein
MCRQKKPGKLDEWLRKRPIPVILGPPSTSNSSTSSSGSSTSASVPTHQAPQQSSQQSTGATCTAPSLPVPGGPPGDMYLIDHHHLALALHRQGVTQTYIQVGTGIPAGAGELILLGMSWLQH